MLAELGLSGFEVLFYYGFFAFVGTPKAALDSFAAVLARVVAQPEVKARLSALGLTVDFMDAPTLAAREQAYTRTWAQIIRKSGFQPL